MAITMARSSTGSRKRTKRARPSSLLTGVVSVTPMSVPTVMLLTTAAFALFLATSNTMVLAFTPTSIVPASIRTVPRTHQRQRQRQHQDQRHQRQPKEEQVQNFWRSHPPAHVNGQGHSASSTDPPIRQKQMRTLKRSRNDKVQSVLKIPSRAYKIYAEYAKRLWTETNSDARHRIADDKVRSSILHMQHLVRSYSDGDPIATEKLLQASNDLLAKMPKEVTKDDSEQASSSPMIVSTKNFTLILPPLDILPALSAETSGKDVAIAIPSTSTPIPKANGESSGNGVAETRINGENIASKLVGKKQRSVVFGALMGAVVACWVFSGNYVFTGIFTLMTILGQLEYYRMVMNAGIYPARRISVIGACSMFLTALFAPSLHQICLPMFGLWSMIWFLTMRRKVSTISEIATTFTGMFYLGYVPSFWVRTRLIGLGAREPTRLAPIAAPFLDFINRIFKKHIPVPEGLIYLPITTGAIFIFWSWLCLAFSDVGGYFVGRAFGKTKLGKIAPAAGATSPNKTVEGVIGGCAASAALGMLGAWVQKWPWWGVTGCIHGLALGLLGLIGDLTASMLKRDAGIKDFGDLIPEHGGIMDRVDSFIWTAPYSWLICAYVIPALKAFVAGR